MLPFLRNSFTLLLICTLATLRLSATTEAEPVVVTEITTEEPAPGANGAEEDAAPGNGEAGESEAEAEHKEEAEESDPDAEHLAELRKERELIQAENALLQERMRRELNDMSEQRARLEAETALAREQLNAELRSRRIALERLNLDIEEATKNAQLVSTLRRTELDRELEEMKLEEERLRASNALAQQQFEARAQEMRIAEMQLKMERQELDMRLVRLQSEIQYRDASDVVRDRVPNKPEYTLDVFDGGRLVISDRRIPLNGPIWTGTADFIQERIDFFNNQNDEYPIFIVIDYSPGGSVMAGYRILKSMEGSKAPVYVVVRSFAASMAATITTLAEKSFAYPNSIILHHQMMWVGWGNVTQQRERLKEAEEWWNRLATPIAARMGLTIEEFIEQMYQRFSDGDWREFADRAVDLGWVTHVIEEISEASVEINPDRVDRTRMSRARMELDFTEHVDEKGNVFIRLPRLAPFDFYHLYNPDGYYRVR